MGDVEVVIIILVGCKNHMSQDGLILTSTAVNVAGSIGVSRSPGTTHIGTLVPTDTLFLNADTIALSGFSNAGNTTYTSSLSNAGNSTVGGLLTVGSNIHSDGSLSLGTINSSICGLSIGDPHTSSNSLLWHLGPSGQSSHWELVGGDLRVTRIRTDVPSESRAVSYTLRVANDDALEIHQSTSNMTGQSFHRRVARFGGHVSTSQ